jgi:hypothetical protein
LAGERVERRLMAILATDVAGYRRLVSDDEEGTLAQWKAYRRDATTSVSLLHGAGDSQHWDTSHDTHEIHPAILSIGFRGCRLSRRWGEHIIGLGLG